MQRQGEFIFYADFNSVCREFKKNKIIIIISPEFYWNNKKRKKKYKQCSSGESVGTSQKQQTHHLSNIKLNADR